MKDESRQPYGVGLAYRACLHHEIMDRADELDVLEIPTEDYVVRARRLDVDPDGQLLREAIARLPAVAHGIQLSIGSVQPLDEEALRRTRQFLDTYGFDVFSEHLAYHRVDGVDVRTFLCMPFEEASLRWLTARYEEVRERLGRPFALENVSYYYPVPGCSLDEADFLTQLTERTDCTLLLDLTNVYNNAVNHGYDPAAFIRRLPGERVSQLHLAGGYYENGMWVDSHSRPVMPPVWDLLDVALEHTAAGVVVLERDDNFHPFGAVLADVRRARAAFWKRRSSPCRAQIADRGRSRTPPDAAGEVEQLGRFQSATVAIVSDPAVRQRWDTDPAGVAGAYGLDECWSRRLLACDRDRLALLQRRWLEIDQRRQARQREDELREWAIWARLGKK